MVNTALKPVCSIEERSKCKDVVSPGLNIGESKQDWAGGIVITSVGGNVETIAGLGLSVGRYSTPYLDVTYTLRTKDLGDTTP